MKELFTALMLRALFAGKTRQQRLQIVHQIVSDEVGGMLRDAEGGKGVNRFEGAECASIEAIASHVTHAGCRWV
jgi:hypothetical protein